MPRSPRERFRGYTLVELVVSMSIMTVMVGGMASAMVIASRALDMGNSPAADALHARKTAGQMVADLNVALNFSERTENAVTFTVPDRCGDAMPETIRYAWSGNAGDPLIRQYNGGNEVPIAEDVQRFDLTYLLRTLGPPTEACCYNSGSCVDELPADCLVHGGKPEGEDTVCETFDCPQPQACCFHGAQCQDLPPEVCETDGGTAQGLATDCAAYQCPLDMLFVVDDGLPKGQDLTRKALMESWGYTVTLISDKATQAEFDAAMADSAVAYISGEIDEGDIGTKLTHATIGVVTEQRKMPKSDKLGIWEKEWGEFDHTAIVIDNNTHYITSGFNIGSRTILSSTQKLLRSDGKPAAGAEMLASKVGEPARKTLVTIDAGATLYDGSPAVGRRVAMPWGKQVTTSNLSINGQTLMRRAIEWAAGEE